MRMNHTGKSVPTLIACGLLLVCSAPALPIPRPSSFSGTVTVDGNPVGADLALTTEIGGTEFEPADLTAGDAHREAHPPVTTR